MSRSFLDPDYEPPADQKAAFEAGRQQERDRANSPEEQAKLKEMADEMGRKIAAGFKSIITP
jgi:hypothetical protein